MGVGNRRLRLWRCAGCDGSRLARHRCGQRLELALARRSAGARARSSLLVRPRVPRQQWPARRAACPSIAGPRRAPPGDRVSARPRSTSDRSRGRAGLFFLYVTRGRQRRPRPGCLTPPTRFRLPGGARTSASARAPRRKREIESLIGDFALRRRFAVASSSGIRLAERPPFTSSSRKGASSVPSIIVVAHTEAEGQIPSQGDRRRFQLKERVSASDVANSHFRPS